MELIRVLKLPSCLNQSNCIKGTVLNYSLKYLSFKNHPVLLLSSSLTEQKFGKREKYLPHKKKKKGRIAAKAGTWRVHSDEYFSSASPASDESLQ